MCRTCSARRVRAALVAAAAAAVLLVPATAPAHSPSANAARELLRVQGTRAAAPRGAAVVREVVFVVLGTEHRFHATDWRRFSLGDVDGAPPAERDRLTLQGKRETLVRFASAAPEQVVTLLAERRPGGADLFVLALDLCPPR
jgi:hypothetical protein